MKVLATGLMLMMGVVVVGCGSEDGSGSTPPGSDVTEEPQTSHDQDPPPAEPAGTKKASKQGKYTIWLDGNTSVTRNQIATFNVTIKTSDAAPAPGLTVDTTFVHKAMGHGSNKVPYAEEVGEGVYRIKDVLGNMAGTWMLSLQLKGTAGNDSVSYDMGVQ